MEMEGLSDEDDEGKNENNEAGEKEEREEEATAASNMLHFPNSEPDAEMEDDTQRRDMHNWTLRQGVEPLPQQHRTKTQ
jgi:hypothetical protein